MTTTRRRTHVAIGVLLGLLSLPMASSAQDSVPLAFKEGDVISAEVINALLARLNDVQRGFASEQELVGTWRCTTYDNNAVNACPKGAFVLVGSLFKVTQTITFTLSNGVVTYTAADASPGGCWMEDVNPNNGLGQYRRGTI